MQRKTGGRRFAFWVVVLGVLVVCTHGEVEIVDHFKNRTKLINDHAAKMEAQRSAIDATVAGESTPATKEKAVEEGEAIPAKRIQPSGSTPSTGRSTTDTSRGNTGTDAPATKRVAAVIEAQGKSSAGAVTDAPPVSASKRDRKPSLSSEKPSASTAQKPPLPQTDDAVALPPGKTQWADGSDLEANSNRAVLGKEAEKSKNSRKDVVDAQSSFDTKRNPNPTRARATSSESVVSPRRKDQQSKRPLQSTMSPWVTPASAAPLPDVDDPLFAAFLRDLDKEDSKRPHGEVVDVQCPSVGECLLTYRT